MEARIIISGVGLGIPKTSFSANIASGAYLQVRHAVGAQPFAIFGIAENFTLGSEASTVLVGHAETDWFPVAGEAAEDAFRHGGMAGKVAQIEVSGTFIGSGKTDLKLIVINADGDAVTIFEKYNVSARGGQISSTLIRGKIKSLPIVPAMAAAV